MRKMSINSTSRRNFLKSSLAGGTCAAIPVSSGVLSCSPSGKIPRWLPEPIPKGAEYVLKIKSYIRNIRDNAFGNIKKAADICAEAYAGDHRILYPFYGHSERKGIAEKREGRPGFLTWSRGVEIQANDAYITIHVQAAINAREKGAKVIGISNAFLPQKPANCFTVDKGVAISGEGDFYEGPFLADNCDVFINDQVPYTVGIIAFDGLKSHFGNGVGVMEGYVFWTLVAAISDCLIEKGITFDVLDHSE